MKIACIDETNPEIFSSIQGEGASLGVPSVFVRASLCNLHCVWCDTDYTWNWEGTPFPHLRDAEPGYRKYQKTKQLLELSPHDVAELVQRFAPRNVVLTGGEPLLQQEDFLEVVRSLRAKDPQYRFEVETNATLLPAAEFSAEIAQFNVSPKLTNSEQPVGLREKPEVLTWFARQPGAFFKFVCSSGADLSEVRTLVERYQIPAGRVFLMPQETTEADLNARAKWLIEECQRHGFRYGDRLHIRLWGSRRGV